MYHISICVWMCLCLCLYACCIYIFCASCGFSAHNMLNYIIWVMCSSCHTHVSVKMDRIYFWRWKRKLKWYSAVHEMTVCLYIYVHTRIQRSIHLHYLVAVFLLSTHFRRVRVEHSLCWKENHRDWKCVTFIKVKMKCNEASNGDDGGGRENIICFRRKVFVSKSGNMSVRQ